MSRHQELMQRLAGADPLRDGEQLTSEERREADALLARVLAAPLEQAAAPHRSRSRLRRRALSVAGAACAAVAALVAIDLLDADTSGTSVVDRAVAAVTREGVVFHVLEFTTYHDANLPAGARGEVFFEAWYTSDGRVHQKAGSVRAGQKGRLMEDFAGRRRPGRTVGAALRWDAFSNTISESGFARGEDEGVVPTLDSFQNPATQLRVLHEQGRLRVAETTWVNRNPAYRLVSNTLAVDDGEFEIEYTVDAESYLPLSRRISTELDDGGTLQALTRYRVYERLALSDKTNRLLDLDPHPYAKCSEFAHELTEARDLGFPNPCAIAGREPGRNG
jgi:hypothetical protein